MFFFVISILTNCIEKMLFIRRTWENSQCSCWGCQSAASWSSGSPEKPTKLMLGLVRLHEKKKKSKKKAKCPQLRCRLRPLLSGFTVHCTKHYGQTMQTSAAPMALKSDQPAVVEEQHVSFSQNWTLLTLQENMMTRHHRGPQRVGSSDWLQWTS